ncbi:MAG: hypothetical protein JXB85_09265 [Anaerolineales bacterium]|nr:hypothetical protein [Anaerolineales bacterium]
MVALLVVGTVVLGGYWWWTSQTSTPFPPTPVAYTPTFTLPPQVVTPSATVAWTVIVYSAADDRALEEMQWFDVNEMEIVGSSPQVNIVVQLDRYAGGFTGDGDWTDTRRLHILQDRDLDRITSPIVDYLGETDMGDPQTLVDFVTWGIANFPAENYILIMSDHGGGWTGGYSDGTSNSQLSIPEIAEAFEMIQRNTNIDTYEVLGFDACLMAQIEVFGSLYPYANYIVASEEVVPGYGWSYAAWLDLLVQDPSMDGRRLSQAIVSTYVINDTLLTETRSTPDEIAQEESSTTMSAVESARIPYVIDAMNQLLAAIATADQGIVAQARTYTRSYESVFGERYGNPFIDLGNFARLIANQTGDSHISQAAEQLLTEISQAVIAEKHGARMEGSTGISFHFPNSELYFLTEVNDNAPISYAQSSRLFLEHSSWDEYLAFHYTNLAFIPQEGQAFTPPRAAEIFAPGASELSVGEVEISDPDIHGDELVTISTTIEGNPAYIWIALYYHIPDADSYWIGDITYYITGENVLVDGVNFPNYGESPIEVQFDFNPTLYILTDGEHEAYALFEPAEYLSAEGQMVYAAYGQYTAVNSSGPLDAMLYFDAYGNFLYAYAYPDTDNDGISSPVEIALQPGDHFTDYVQYVAFDDNDQPYYDYEPSQDVWTWGDAGFSFYPAYVPDGEYAVGIIAIDFDGNLVENYVYITYTR